MSIFEDDVVFTSSVCHMNCFLYSLLTVQQKIDMIFQHAKALEASFCCYSDKTCVGKHAEDKNSWYSTLTCALNLEDVHTFKEIIKYG